MRVVEAIASARWHSGLDADPPGESSSFRGRRWLYIAAAAAACTRSNESLTGPSKVRSDRRRSNEALNLVRSRYKKCHGVRRPFGRLVEGCAKLWGGAWVSSRPAYRHDDEDEVDCEEVDPIALGSARSVRFGSWTFTPIDCIPGPEPSADAHLVMCISLEAVGTAAAAGVESASRAKWLVSCPHHRARRSQLMLGLLA
ncbi:hypothetical protein AXG93_1712s1660 [Marchantia polymorpha subsp. ruderalis]|uniref:Uncharacterized protein n=1 Tax=Marchantia polymorpha subsp. ruderalis TaxID=1480154 RepID=A0A176W1B9_MARPO|nr:hypothetical protein AXG93_1712s1660 [Marchantia polymorpha subsp. ruderalis]